MNSTKPLIALVVTLCTGTAMAQTAGGAVETEYAARALIDACIDHSSGTALIDANAQYRLERGGVKFDLKRDGNNTIYTLEQKMAGGNVMALAEASGQCTVTATGVMPEDFATAVRRDMDSLRKMMPDTAPGHWRGKSAVAGIETAAPLSVVMKPAK